MIRFRSILVLLALAACALPARAQPADRVIDRADYQSRLRAMWLGECIANWTGLASEGERQFPPFLTDADWGTSPFPDRPWATLALNLYSSPWNADDDTDIEYVYLHALATDPANRFSPSRLNSVWQAHINQYIWVSNANARNLMSRGIQPPMTALAQGLASGVLPKADQSFMIDAQLTTEFFGALCPGMPDRALAMADLPIRTTAHGHAVHASQYYVVLYSLAAQGDPAMTGAQRAVWLCQQARAYIPDSSKAADIVDFVLADYLANPDKENWERTRDLVYQRYVASAPQHGFVYRAWFESSVNFALGIVALLYGEMNFEKTVRIGTLAGFDADNQAATMGGLVALATAPQFLAQYGWCSDRYRWQGVRDALIDYLPDDPTGDDTFSLVSQRMLPVIDREVLAAGGRVDTHSAWLLPPRFTGAPIAVAPTRVLDQRSANNRVRRAGGMVSVSSNVPGDPEAPFAVGTIDRIADGYEHDFRGLEDNGSQRGFWSTQRAPSTPGLPIEHSFEVRYSAAVPASVVRFIAGDVWTTGQTPGGWFQSVRVELELAGGGGQWVAAPLSGPPPVPDSAQPFQILDFVLASPALVTGARVIGVPAGFVTCCEVDVLDAAPAAGAPSLDIDGNGQLSIDDLYAWHALPRDVDGDSDSDAADEQYLQSALRWGEVRGMADSRR